MVGFCLLAPVSIFFFFLGLLFVALINRVHSGLRRACKGVGGSIGLGSRVQRQKLDIPGQVDGFEDTGKHSSKRAKIRLSGIKAKSLRNAVRRQAR